MSDVPLFFAGSENLSVLVVNNQLIGWGKPNARYFFQMWRDIPSHVIYYRNKLNVSFLPNFTIDPVEQPGADWFRYDYLAKGEVPAGFWVQFNAGIKQNTCFLNKIVYKHYNPDINNLETEKLHPNDIPIESVDFLILLTNLASSTGLLEIIDREKNNVLVGNDDKTRREFNTKFYDMYFAYIKHEIMTNQEFLQKFIKLSGSHIIAYLVESDEEFGSWFHQNAAIIKEMSPYLIHPIVQELQSTPNLIEIRKKVEQDMLVFQANPNRLFYMNNYQ